MRYFIGNWKMFGVPKSINILNKINSFHSKDKNRNKYRVIVTPPYTLIESYAKYFKNKKISINEITKNVTKVFHENCKSLNCLVPTREPKATDHIQEMVEMTKSLIEKNFAYTAEGHVYFSISTFKEYGKLSNKNLDELKAGSRIEISKLKKNPMDFVLWKPSLPDDPGWESPWGRGRPGWHLECSVMSEKYLGKNFDIHGGGLDLIFPHHENEIAQSCCNNSTEKFSNYWVHNGFVTINKEKMSKSLGNIVSISDAVDKYSGQVVRLALLSAHYSQPLDWNEKFLEDQKSIIEKWYQMYDETNEDISLDIIETLLDDLNSPGFIAKIHELYVSAKKGDEQSKKSFKNSEFQKSERDFAFVIDKIFKIGILENIIRGIDEKLIQKVTTFDVYEGENIPEGKKSVAINITLQSFDKTLTENDLDQISQNIINVVSEKTGATIRS